MKKLLFIIFLLAPVIFISCGESRFVVMERPIQPVYIRPSSPGANYLWIEGDWHRSGNGYSWSEGRWEKSRQNHKWEAGSWEQHGKGYSWHQGHWH